MKDDKNSLVDVRPAGSALQCRTLPAHRILVVEDDNDIRRLNTELLIHFGYEVDAAEDGAVAWQALNADRYNLLITDNNMPNVSGIELLRKIHDARIAVPVIMATGRLPQAEFNECPWLQPAATLLKPYSIAELLGKVKEVLHATDGARVQIDMPPPNRQIRPSADGFQA